MRVLKTLLRGLVRLVGCVVGYLLLLKVVRKLVHFPVPAFVGRFLDSDLRRAMQPPEPIVARSDVQAGMRVLEIGCGSGGYTTYLARAAGPAGEVCALDIQPAMLDLLAAKLARPENQDIRNVKCFAENAYALPFENDTFDRVVMITVLQEIPNRARALVEARRVLKPGGKLAITEFLPDPDYALARTTAKLGTAVGLHLDAVLGNLWTYTARFVK